MFAGFLFFFLCLSSVLNAQDTLVPAILTFGDSAVDVGNNNYLFTLIKANFLPYGRDFVTRQPTGRFCNGKLATDLTADFLGFTTYPLPYLSPEATGKNLLIGANFASAGSGLYDGTAILNKAIPLSRQLELFKEYQSKLLDVPGSNYTKIISEGLYLLSAGSGDFVQNYYVNPFLHHLYTPDQFADFLVGLFTNFVKDLYFLGARRIAVTSLPPLGCVPLAITLFGFGSNGCVSRLNVDAQNFNRKINNAITGLRAQLSDLRIVNFEIYKPLLDIINDPAKFSFAEARKGCCGTGILETSILCNQRSIGTCANASQYVFWDSVHPTEATNQVISSNLLAEGISLFS